jgi:hypothetical protein
MNRATTASLLQLGFRSIFSMNDFAAQLSRG